MSNNEMILAVFVWLVSLVMTLAIFVLDDRVNSDNYIKTLVFASLPVVNTVFVLRSIIGWFKND